MFIIVSMITAIPRKNMAAIPARLAQRCGLKPGYRLEWSAGNDERMLTRVIPDRRQLSRRLLGQGRRFAPKRDAVAERIEERVRMDARMAAVAAQHPAGLVRRHQRLNAQPQRLAARLDLAASCRYCGWASASRSLSAHRAHGWAGGKLVERGLPGKQSNSAAIG